MWTFGRRIGGAFSLTFVLLAVIGATAYRNVDTLTRTSYSVAHSHAINEGIGTLLSQVKDAETGQRGFVLTGDEAFLEPYTAAMTAIPASLRELRALAAGDGEESRGLDQAEPLISRKLAELQRTIAIRRSAGLEPTIKAIEEGTGKRVMDDLRRVLGDLERAEHDRLKARGDEVEAAASMARMTIFWGTLLSLLLSVVVAAILTRALTRQVGSAVRNVQSSSAELQAAANQQVTGAKEQATAMTEITTTISELLATSRQIAESAQRVARIAADTAGSARGGEETVDADPRLDRGHQAPGRRHRRAHGRAGPASRSRSAASWTSSTSWPSRRTSWPSTPPSRRPGPATRGGASAWWPTRSASWPTGSAGRPRTSARWSTTCAPP